MTFPRILNMSISASWLVMAVLGLRFVLRKAPKAFRCALWALVAIRLVCPVLPESPVSLIPTAEIVPDKYLYMELREYQEQAATLNIMSKPVYPEAVEIKLDTTVDRVQTMDIYWTLVWWTGMGVMAIYALYSYTGLRLRMRISVKLRDNIWICDDIHSPFILGILRPRIYLPSNLESSRMPYVLAHEKAHIKRRDHWWKPFGFVLLTIHWFNPVMWIAYIVLCRDIELACDERVIRDMDKSEVRKYSETLVACSVSGGRIIVCPLAFGEVGVKERVKSMLSYKKPGFWIILVALVLCVALVVCFMTNPVTGGPVDGGEETIRTDTIGNENVMFAGAYVPYQCLYMNPLSSYYAFGGDSGCVYQFYDSSFAIETRNGSVIVYDPIVWNWKKIDWTAEPFSGLLRGLGFPDNPDLSAILTKDAVCQLLNQDDFLLYDSGHLLLAHTSEDPKGNRYLWSVYSLVPEEQMGWAQWKFNPMLSSQYPAFRFAFDMEYTSITATCLDGTLTSFDEPSYEGYPSGSTLEFPAGTALYWSPWMRMAMW